MSDTPNTVPTASEAVSAAMPTAEPGADSQLTPQVAKGAPDTTDGAQNPQTPSQAPQSPQAASDGPNPPSGAQQPQQGQDGAAKPAAAVPAAQPARAAVPPAVQHASIIHSIAQTLAGGPRSTYAIDPNTGEMKATQQPLSGKSIAQAIAIAALSGGFAGLSQKGPGSNIRAAAAGFGQVQQQQQEQDAQAKQEASQTYARQAAITQTNFQTHQNALRLSQEELDYHKQFVGSAEPVLKNINAVGAVQEAGVRESDLLTKYHVTKDMAIPDGVVENGKNKDGSTHWENTYSVVDPNKKIALPDETAKLLADLRIPGYFAMKDGKAVPQDFSGSAGIRAGLVVNGLATAQGFQITEGQINKQFAALKGGDKDAAQFDVNLKQSLASGDITLKGLQTIGNYAGLPLDKALDEMRKNKVDPAIVAQFQKLIPQDAVDQIKKVRMDTEAADKAKRDTDAAVGKQTALLPGELAKTKAEERLKAQYSFQNAFNAEAGRVQAKNKYGEGGGTVNHDMVNNPVVGKALAAIDPNAPVVNGARKGALEAVAAGDPILAAEIKAIGEGRQLPSKYGLAKADGQRLASLVATVYPGFTQSKSEAYEKLQNRFTAGDVSDQLRSLNTTFEHAQQAYENAGHLSAGIPGTAAYAEFETDKSQLTEEINHAYTKGVLHAERAAELKAGLNSPLPSVRQKAVKEGQKLLSDFAGEFQNQWGKGKVTDAAVDAPIVSDEGQRAFNDLFHGERQIDKYGRVQLLQAPKGANGIAPDSKGVWYWHDPQGKILGRSPAPAGK